MASKGSGVPILKQIPACTPENEEILPRTRMMLKDDSLFFKSKTFYLYFN